MLSRDNYQEKHHYRKRLIEEGLLQYKDMVMVSDRNKLLVEEYAQGGSYADLARKYELSSTRVAQIVHSYIRHCVLLHKGMEPYKNTKKQIIEARSEQSPLNQ